MNEFFKGLFSTTQGKRKLIGFSLSVAGVVVILILFNATIFFERFEKQALGFWFFIRYPEARNLQPGVSKLEYDPDVRDDIVIAAIDDESVQKIGLWPWPRWTSAELINFLGEAGARMIVYDVFFISKTNLPENDVLLRDAIKKAGNVFLNYPFTKEEVYREGIDKDETEKTISSYVNKFSFSPEQVHGKKESLEIYKNLTPVLGTFAEVAKGMGHANVEPDPDGTLRTALLVTEWNGRYYPSLALLAALDYYKTPVSEARIDLGDSVKLRGGVEIPINENGEMVVDYVGMGKFRYVPFVQIIEGGIPPEFFKDKIVYVGSTSVGAFDLRVTPLAATPGVEYWATVLNNLLNRNFIVPVPPYVNIVILLALGVVLGFVFPFVRPLISALVFIGAIVIMAGVAFLLFYNGIWINFVTPFSGVLLGYVSITLYRYMTEQREKRLIHGMFATYVHPSLVKELVNNPAMLKLGGEKKNLTVFFSDLSGFTSISEMMTAEELVSLLNEYLTAMVDIIQKYNGTVDKYEGDAIMAIWGAPVYFEDHAIKACYAALDMQKEMVGLRERWLAAGRPRVSVRMGINTGDMIAGNMGSRDRFNYTVMGDSVNLAARLEPANKVYGTYTMISEYTYERVKDLVIARELDSLQVKGKTEPVKVYELMATKEDGLSEAMNKVLEHYHRGMELYKNRQWDEAIAEFQMALSVNGGKEGPSETYVERCKEYKENPPPPTWKGEYVMTTKG